MTYRRRIAVMWCLSPTRPAVRQRPSAHGTTASSPTAAAAMTTYPMPRAMVSMIHGNSGGAKAARVA
jgi:hypothetical protein